MLTSKRNYHLRFVKNISFIRIILFELSLTKYNRNETVLFLLQ